MRVVTYDGWLKHNGLVSHYACILKVYRFFKCCSETHATTRHEHPDGGHNMYVYIQHIRHLILIMADSEHAHVPRSMRCGRVAERVEALAHLRTQRHCDRRRIEENTEDIIR